VTLLLGGVIDGIRNEHPAFDKTRVPDPVLSKALDRYQRALIAKAVFRDKTFLSDTVTVAAPTTVDMTVPLAGVPDAIAFIGGWLVRDTGKREQLEEVSVARRLEAGRTVTLMNGKFYQNGSDPDWRAITELELTLIPLPPPLQNARSAFLLPEMAESALVAHGAFKAARRAESFDDTVNVDQFRVDAQQAETEYLSTFRLNKRARITTFREGDY
jgi:hypothetical protein